MQNSTLISLLSVYKYPIIFPLATFEGPVVALVVGFLVSTGLFSFWPAYFVMILGDLIPDSMFYLIGFYGNGTKVAKRYLSKSEFFSNHFPAVRRLWEEHPVKTMFFGKLAYGMALPFLITAGMTKMPFKKFFRITFPITLFQYGALMFIGDRLGSLYGTANKYIEWFYFGLAVLVVIFIFIYLIRFARNKVTNIEKEANL